MDALPAEAVVPYPGAGPLRALIDKVTLARLAAAAGVRSPEVLAVGSAGDLLAAPPAPPCVVKSALISESLPATVVCETGAELRTLLAGLPAAEMVVVQRREAGPLVALTLVLDRDGAVVARFQQEARRLWPRTAGASSVGVSVAPEPDLVATGARVLREAGYWGMSQLQFLGPPGERVLVDANTRFYGSLPLALAAGVNLPAAWHAVALGRPAGSPGEYRVGVVYHWLEAELTAVYRRERSPLPERLGRPRAGAMWAWDDPVPAVMLTYDAWRARLSRRLVAPGR
jgi:predicted ATP-grasp superfamily ATP-dependent carboligase